MRSPDAVVTQKSVLAIYMIEVSVKNDWKEPKRSMNTPVPMVLTIAASVPAVFDIPARYYDMEC